MPRVSRNHMRAYEQHACTCCCSVPGRAPPFRRGLRQIYRLYALRSSVPEKCVRSTRRAELKNSMALVCNEQCCGMLRLGVQRTMLYSGVESSRAGGYHCSQNQIWCVKRKGDAWSSGSIVDSGWCGVPPSILPPSILPGINSSNGGGSSSSIDWIINSSIDWRRQ